MENKLTAVEWLKYQALEGTVDKSQNVMYLKFPLDVFIKAQEIEKEQIKDACEEGFMWSAEGWNGEMISYYKDGNETLELHKEEYYNQTYGKI